MFGSKGLVVLALGAIVAVQAAPQQCKDQSCLLAYRSGSTKSKYPLPAGVTKLEGQNDEGDACARKNLKELKVDVPGVSRFLELLTNSTFNEGFLTETLGGRLASTMQQEQQADCKPETLLYARGSAESGEFGNIKKIGLSISEAFTKAGWGAIGIKKTDGYDADMKNNFCAGLPGGVACIPWLNAQVARCPNTKFVFGGYSQGAMVARICIAFANDAAKKAVKGLLLFGDPMNGADNKGISSDRIKTICDPGDGVCSGKFKISGAHLSYADNADAGLKWAQQIIKT